MSRAPGKCVGRGAVLWCCALKINEECRLDGIARLRRDCRTHWRQSGARAGLEEFKTTRMQATTGHGQKRATLGDARVPSAEQPGENKKQAGTTWRCAPSSAPRIPSKTEIVSFALYRSSPQDHGH